MKRKLLSLAMIAALCLTMLPTAGWAADGEIDDWQVPEAPTTTGSWTDAGNYEINWYTDNPSATEFELEDAADLAGLAAIVNGTAKNASGATIKDDFAGDTITVKSGSTIDLKDKQWTPIGNRAAYAFKGTFDGKNVEITGMTISGDSAISGAGLFGYVNNGIVQNVSVSGAYINATIANNGAVGGIVGILTGTQNDESNQGKISNCSFSGNIIVNGKELVTCAGGIVGSVSSLGYGGVYPNLIVESCENKATIQGVAIYMGGIAGNNGKADTIKSCTNNGKLQSTRYSQNALGGIVGYTQGAVEQCENKAVVTSIGRTTPADGYGTYYVGGIAGLMRACEISGCKNTAAVSSAHSVYMGGLLVVII